MSWGEAMAFDPRPQSLPRAAELFVAALVDHASDSTAWQRTNANAPMRLNGALTIVGSGGLAPFMCAQDRQTEENSSARTRSSELASVVWLRRDAVASHA